MPISIYQHDPNYFTNKTKIKALDIDVQLNRIVDYINLNVIPTLNKLVSNQFNGVDNPVYNNSFLTNIGDGTIGWKYLTNDSFAPNSLSISKLEQGDDNSILVTNTDGELYFLAPTANNQIISGVPGDSTNEKGISFSAITNNHITNRAILNRMIKDYSLTLDNLSPDSYNISNYSLVGSKFAEGSITNNQVEIGSATTGLSANNLTVALAAEFPTMINSAMIPSNYFKDSWNVVFGGGNIYSVANAIEYERIFSLSSVIYDISKFAQITTAHIANYDMSLVAPNSIIGDRLHFLNGTTNKWNPSDESMLEDGAIKPEHLTQELRTLLDL